MELTVVGCSGSVSGPDSPASCYLIRAPYQGGTFALVLDLGPGAFGALNRYLDPREVGAFGLSHLHPDHCLDLCSYYVAARYSPSAPWPGQQIYGPAGTAQRMARAYEVDPPGASYHAAGESIAEHFDYRHWQPSQRIGPFRVRTTRVEHPVEAYAIRVDEIEGAHGSLVYSGDTGPCTALVELALGADLLLAEAAFMADPANQPGVHHSGRDAAQAAERAGVAALVLTHIPPWNDRDQVRAEAVPHFRGPVALAMAGASWSVGG